MSDHEKRKEQRRSAGLTSVQLLASPVFKNRRAKKIKESNIAVFNSEVEDSTIKNVKSNKNSVKVKRNDTNKSAKSIKSITSINKNILNVNLNIQNPHSRPCIKCYSSTDKVNSQPINTLECNHYMCTSCINELVEENINDKNIAKITCIECGRSLSKNYIAKFCTEDNYIKYIKLLNENENTSVLSDLTKCPKKSCNGYAVNPIKKKKILEESNKVYINSSPLVRKGSRSKSLLFTNINEETNNVSNNTNKGPTNTLNKQELRGLKQDYFYIKCENNHLFCYFCKGEVHGDKPCENSPFYKNKTNTISINNSLSSFLTVKEKNKIKNKIFRKCPNCENLCDKVNYKYSTIRSSNALTCSNCHISFCVICNSRINNIKFHYYNPFNSCILMEYSDSKSIYLKNDIIKFFRHIFILIFTLFVLYPLFFLLSPFIISYLFNKFYLTSLIENQMMRRISIKYITTNKNSCLNYISLKIPKISLIFISIYNYSFCILINSFLLIIFIFSPFWLVLFRSYKYMNSNNRIENTSSK